jgi:hypothetical protein
MEVMIGTPALNGQVDAWYANSLSESIKLSASNGINISPLILIEESILPMARNEIINYALMAEVDSLVFIDSDQAWDSNCLLSVITSPLDVIGVPVINKSDREQYNVSLRGESKIDKNGYLNADAVGTGFLKLSKRVIERVWSVSKEVSFRGKTLREVFKYGTDKNEFFIGEDINFCYLLRNLGYTIYIDTRWTCAHIGRKKWEGDFKSFVPKAG